MTKLGSRVLLVCAGLLTGTLLCELDGAGYIYARENRLVWLSAENRAPTPASSQGLATDGHRLRLHPYYGYMALPGMRLADVTAEESMRRQFGDRFVANEWRRLLVNNAGFISMHDYPYRYDTNRIFVIGIFGGSVALQFALTMEPTMRRLLGEVPAAKGKDIVLLAFANGGAKQPQQLTTLAYFLSLGQRFDYIVNLDGFNELFIGWYNLNEHATSIDMPFARFVNGIQTIALEAHRNLRGDAATTKSRLSRMEREASAARLALRVLVFEAFAHSARAALARLEGQMAKLDAKDARHYAMPIPIADPQASARFVTDIADLWLRGSQSMHDLAVGAGIRYLHVLQPNQYYSNEAFTAEQRAQFLSLQHPPVANIVPAVYRAYLERVPSLRQRGVDFLDASSAFSGHGDVWIDSCCHFNEAANIRLAGLIVERIRARPPVHR